MEEGYAFLVLRRTVAKTLRETLSELTCVVSAQGWRLPFDFTRMWCCSEVLISRHVANDGPPKPPVMKSDVWRRDGQAGNGTSGGSKARVLGIGNG